LLEATINFSQILVACVASVKFTAKTDHFATDSCNLLFSEPSVSVQILRSLGFDFLLTKQLPLGFKQEVVALVGTLTVLLQTRQFSAASADLRPCNVEARIGFVGLDELVHLHLLQSLPSVLQRIEFDCALVGLV